MHHLIPIREYLPEAIIDLKYAGTDNFAEKIFYPGDFEAMLTKDAVVKLVKAHEILKSIRPGWKFVIWDAARPHAVQMALFEEVKGTDKEKYIAHPEIGSLHNYGCAIDIGLINSDGQLMDMGTIYDYFGALAEPSKEIDFLHSGELPEAALANRLLLRYIMTCAGFQPIPHEWWHFNHCPIETAKEKYTIF